MWSLCFQSIYTVMYWLFAADLFDFTLTTMSGPLTVMEGQTIDIEITRNFPTELLIMLSIRGDGIANSEFQFPFEGNKIL